MILVLYGSKKGVSNLKNAIERMGLLEKIVVALSVILISYFFILDEPLVTKKYIFNKGLWSTTTSTATGYEVNGKSFKKPAIVLISAVTIIFLSKTGKKKEELKA